MEVCLASRCSRGFQLFPTFFLLFLLLKLVAQCGTTCFLGACVDSAACAMAEQADRSESPTRSDVSEPSSGVVQSAALRIVIVDGGCSSIEVAPDCIERPLVDWKELREVQQEVKAAVVIVCGAPAYATQLTEYLQRMFPKCTIAHTANNCSSNVSVVEQSCGLSCGVAELRLSSQGRMAQVLNLRGNDGSAFKIVFTKQHHGGASSEYEFDVEEKKILERNFE